MKINEFIEKSAGTAIYPNRKALGGLVYVLLGLSGECGEVDEILKKVIRDNDGIIPDVDRIKSEVGDALWYWSQMIIETAAEFDEDIDVDAFQAELYKDFMGDREIFTLDDPMLVYIQVSILSKIEQVKGRLWTKYDMIQSKEDYPGVMADMTTELVEILRILAIFLANLDIKMSEAMQGNLDKLDARKRANKIKGSGETLDER